jgi:endonuclease/exonuclease/phosphatase (EEP) superfamily protein YafD
MGRRLAYGFALLIALLTFVPQVVRADWWLLRALDFPRAQLFVLALVAAGALAPFLERPRRRPRSAANLLFVAALAAAVLQGARILPYTPLWRDQVHSAAGAAGPTIRLLVANVLIDNRDRTRLLHQVGRWKPDVIVLTEPDAWWAAALRPLREDYPHTVEVPLPNAYGMMLYSRLPLLDA